MTDHRRDDTNPPPPPRRTATQAGPVRLGSPEADPFKPRKEAERQAREEAIDAEEARLKRDRDQFDRERADWEAAEVLRNRAPIPIQSKSPTGISGAINIITKATTWTPGHIVLSLSFLLFVVVNLLGGTDKIADMLSSSKENTRILLEVQKQVTAQGESMRDLQEKVIEHEREIGLVTGLASELNSGKPNATWQTAGQFDGPPAGQVDRVPRFTTRSQWEN